MRDEPEDEEPIPNARQLAEAAAALQELGARLLALSPAQLADMPITESLRDSVIEAKRLPPRTKAMARQMQHIGKLMRGVDAEAVEARLEHHLKGRPAAALQRTAVNWSRRLLAEGDAALQQLASAHPQLERQRLRQTLRRVGKLEPGTATRAAAERELVAELRVLLGGGKSAG